MSSPYARIHNYFVIRQAGTPSSTIQLEYATAVSGNDHEPPAWLIRHCEVGDAIERLPRDERDAVVERWEAVVLIEECTRAIRLASAKTMECRREGKDPREWERVTRDAEKEFTKYARRASRMGRDYRSGMDALILAMDGVDNTA